MRAHLPHARTSDPGLALWDFADPVWYRCPDCDGPLWSGRVGGLDSRRIACRCVRCGAVPSGVTLPGGLPLYLTAWVSGEELWAYNLAHLDALETWLSASLRERSIIEGGRRNRTMVSRLPLWMKRASMRPKVVRAIRLLRAQAIRAGIR